MSPGRQKLAFLDVDRLAGAGHGVDEIGLAAKEGRGLQHVHHGSRRVDLADIVHIGQHRHADALPHFGKRIFSPSSTPRTAKRLPRTAVGLVVGRFEDERHAQLRADFLERSGGIQRKLPRFDDTGAGNQEYRLIEADLEAAQFHAAAAEAAGRLCALPVFSPGTRVRLQRRP